MTQTRNYGYIIGTVITAFSGYLFAVYRSPLVLLPLIPGVLYFFGVIKPKIQKPWQMAVGLILFLTFAVLVATRRSRSEEFKQLELQTQKEKGPK